MSDYSNSRYKEISTYSTPVNYSSSHLTRGSSLQDVSPAFDSPSRRPTRQSSLDKDRVAMSQHKTSRALTPGLHHEQSVYQDLVRSRRTTATRSGKEEKKRRPVNCNKVGKDYIC